MTTQTNDERGLIATFPSVREFMRQAMTPGKGDLVSEQKLRTHNSGFGRDNDWLGLEDGEARNASELAALLDGGWRRGAQRIESALDAVASLTNSARNVRRRNVWGDQGGEVDIDRVRSGSIDRAWRRTQKAPCAAAPRVIVVSDMCVPCNVDSEVMFWTGAASVALAQALCTAGYAVQCVSVMSWRAGKQFTGRVIAKDFDAPFDLSTMAAACASPTMTRVFGFSYGWGHTSIQHTDRSVCGPSSTPIDRIQDLDPQAKVIIVPQRLEDADAVRPWIAKAIGEIEATALPLAA